MFGGLEGSGKRVTFGFRMGFDNRSMVSFCIGILIPENLFEGILLFIYNISNAFILVDLYGWRRVSSCELTVL
jgi:hypothetical protein